MQEKKDYIICSSVGFNLFSLSTNCYFVSLIFLANLSSCVFIFISIFVFKCVQFNLLFNSLGVVFFSPQIINVKHKKCTLFKCLVFSTRPTLLKVFKLKWETIFAF